MNEVKLWMGTQTCLKWTNSSLGCEEEGKRVSVVTNCETL